MSRTQHPEPQRAKVLSFVQTCLNEEDRRRSVIYWDRRVLHAGDSVGPAVPARRAPFDCILVFVDLMPDRNWAHPVLYLFVDPDTGRCEIERDSFPPYLDEQPESFVVLMQHGAEPPS